MNFIHAPILLFNYLKYLLIKVYTLATSTATSTALTGGTDVQITNMSNTQTNEAVEQNKEQLILIIHDRIVKFCADELKSKELANAIAGINFKQYVPLIQTYTRIYINNYNALVEFLKQMAAINGYKLDDCVNEITAEQYLKLHEIYTSINAL